MNPRFHLFAARIVPDGGPAPERFTLFKAGIVEVEEVGTVRVDRKAYDETAAYFRRRGNDLVLDYEHQTLTGEKAPAAGWITALEWEENTGIVAVVQWTEEAAGHIEAGEYRYFSPVFAVRESDRRLVAIHSVALTNVPKTNQLTPLLAAKLGAELETIAKEENMDFFKKLFGLLGLAEGATEDEALTAVAKLKEKPPETKEVIAKEVLDALELSEADTSTVVASIHALKQAQKGTVSREEFERLQRDLKKRDADQIVAKAMADGKITPDQKDWATEYAERDPDGFKTFVAKAPVVIPLDKLPHKKAEADAATLNEATLAVAKMMDVDPEDIKKYGA